MMQFAINSCYLLQPRQAEKQCKIIRRVLDVFISINLLVNDLYRPLQSVAYFDGFGATQQVRTKEARVGG